MKQKKPANSDASDRTLEKENGNNKVPFEENGIPSYRKKQTKKRRSRNGNNIFFYEFLVYQLAWIFKNKFGRIHILISYIMTKIYGHVH